MAGVFFWSFGSRGTSGFVDDLILSEKDSPPLNASSHSPDSSEFFQLAGLLQTSQRGDSWIEQKQQHQHAVLVHVKRSIACLIAFATNIVQLFKQTIELVEVHQPDNR
ncbi:MAG: hypothetical protein R3C49_16620 [Planctomycetaceae bacterium]